MPPPPLPPPPSAAAAQPPHLRNKENAEPKAPESAFSRQYFALGVGGRTLPLTKQGFADKVRQAGATGATPPPGPQRKRSASFNRPKQAQAAKARQRSASFQRQRPVTPSWAA